MSASGLWPWLALVGLGLFHGVNPAMGWLFAVALGLQRGSAAAVAQALPPIALGHAAAIALAVALVALARPVIDATWLRLAAALALIGFGAWHLARGYRHQLRFGMNVGFADLALWSFLMATAHGAGLMLVPFLLPMASTGSAAAHHAGHHAGGGSLLLSLIAIGTHTLAMLVVTGVIAVLVYDWVGVAFLRRGWINLDPLWTVALIAAGLLLLAGV
jgi:hypothetical protein